MDITECRLCGRIVKGEWPRICRNCLHRLDEVYSDIHNYMRDNPYETFDIEKLSEDLDINPADIQMLIELGYIDREIAMKSEKDAARKRLAGIFADELEDMKKKKVTSYGGAKYARGSDSSRQYVYDAQARSAHRK